MSQIADGDALRVHEVLRRWGPAYLDRFGTTMPAVQRRVLNRILVCRTDALGWALFQCPRCSHQHRVPASCNDRHCPRCGNTDTQTWLSVHTRLLLPVPYFLVTFTLPEPLRAWMRSHPALGYPLFFAATSRALQDLARNPKRLGASLAMLAILHTWSRTLLYHPHIHYLVPGGGLSADRRSWIPSRHKFLLPHRPLALHFRTLFHQALQDLDPDALKTLPAKIWKQRWVVDVQAVGNGEHTLRYLSRYVFKTATANRQVRLLPDDRLLWSYRDSRTREWKHIPLAPSEFIRRFLQHVLPPGFHRVRLFGWFHPAARVALNHVRALLRQPPHLTPAEHATWQVPKPVDPVAEPEEAWDSPLECPHCHVPLKFMGTLRPSLTITLPPTRAPP